MERKVFAIVGEENVDCPKGTMVEISFTALFTMDNFIQLPSNGRVWVKCWVEGDDKVACIKKQCLKDFWLV